MEPREAVARVLEAGRRRLLFVAFLRQLVRLSSVATICAAAAFMFLPFARNAWPLGVAGAASAAVCLAAAIAWSHAPTRRQAAIALDRAAHLDDVAVTAVQVFDVDDAVATLVVGDAAARFAGLDPRRLFPVQLSRVTRQMAGAACLTALVAAAWGASFSSVAPNQGSPYSQLPAGTSRAAARSRASAAQNSPPAGIVQVPGKGTETAAPRPNQPSASDTQSGRQPAALFASMNARPPDVRGTSAIREWPEARSNSGVASAREGVAGKRAAASGGGAPGGTNGVSQSGGLKTFEQLAPNTATYAGQYSAAWARAQAAIAQQRIPASRRECVKNYFISIRPAGNAGR